MLSFLKAFFIRALERAGLVARARNQSFDFVSVSTITNTGDKDSAFSVIIPIPQETRSQRLLQPIECSDTGFVMHREGTYGNRFGLWHGKIAPGQTRECRVSCSVAVSPLRVAVSRSERIEKYNKLPSDVVELYTTRNRYVDGDDSRIHKIIEDVAPTIVLVGEYLKKTYSHVLSTLSYGNPIRGLYSSKDAMTLAAVDCGGFSTLMISLLNARRIPARLAVGFFGSKQSNNSMHAWLEALLPNGEWMPIDPATGHLFWKGRDRTKSGGFGTIGSDHIMTSVGCDIPITIHGVAHRIDLLQYPILVEGKAQGLAFETYTL